MKKTSPQNRNGLPDLPASNSDFLRAVFGGIADPLRPFVLGFAGTPASQKNWAGTPWRADRPTAENDALNWYFTLAAFKPVDGIYKRQERQCGMIFGVMLDDLGTKSAPLERLNACPPSYVIETSAGNHQAGYLLDTPQTDLAAVVELNEAMVRAGLCDPGAKSPATRWGRLPFASNGKHTPPFPCRLMAFEPTRRYSIAQIMEGLELVPPSPKRRAAPRLTRAEPTTEHADGDVFTPAQDENPVLAALKLRGLYKGLLGVGKHDITCPWVNLHTDQSDHGTAYFEPTDSYPIGGFKCQHGHCADKRVGALLEHLGLSFTVAKNRPIIRVIAGELHRIADTAERLLSQTGRYFQRGGMIVSIATDPASQETTVRPLSQNALLGALSAVATWLRMDGRSKEWAVTDPPARHAGLLFDAVGYQHLPPLEGLARQPYLRAGGTLCDLPGYDCTSAIYGTFDPAPFSIAAAPTRADAQLALQELRGLLNEFEFATQHDESAAVAAMLTAAARPALAAAPMFLIKAAMYGSGKSFLSGLVSMLASPERPGVLTYPQTDEECTKLLLARLLAAPAVLSFDNLKHDLHAHESLCSALTEPKLTGRILGVSKTATVGTRTLFLSSGNNVEPLGDLTRRVLTITLQSRSENPATRTFNGDPQRDMRARRAHYVSAALTVIRAWIHAEPPRLASKPLGSFELWSDWCREPLLWLGLEDPAAAMFTGMANDPDRQTLQRLLHAWHSVLQDRPLGVKAICAHSDAALREAVEEIALERGEVNRRRFGRWLARHQNRLVDGLTLMRAGSAQGAELWRVVAAGGLGGKSGSLPASLAKVPQHLGEEMRYEGEVL